MLHGFPVMIAGLDTFDNIEEVAETGATFSENAQLKAAGYARQTGLAAVADDSGLEVAALGGRPGVLSARYGGDALTFDEKMDKLLAEIASTGSSDRSAQFVCSMALSDPRGKILHAVDGVCPGNIAQYPRGSGGFGYDPIFVPEGYDETFGELPDHVKADISHRGRAFLRFVPILRDFLASST